MKKVLSVCLALLLAGAAQAHIVGNLREKVSRKIVSQEEGTMFLQAINEHNLSVVNAMLQQSRKPTLLVNYKDGDGNNSLMISVEKGYFDFLPLLEKNKVDVNAPNNDNWTALCSAANNKDLRMVGYLVGSMKADVNYECGTGRHRTSPLLLASEGHSNTLIVDILVKAHANVNYRDPEGYTPLMELAYGGNVVAMDILVKAGADINAEVPSYKGRGMPVAFCPIWTGELPALKYLMEQGAELHGYFVDGGYAAPLDIATNGGPEMVEYVKSLGFTDHNFHDPTWD